jgi:6-phosphogluconate dehydrogenase
VFLYVPHGKATESTIAALAELWQPGDVVVDGGNSHWKDSVRHYQELKDSHISFLDVGTSGGVDGARWGACFMAGGDADAFAKVEPLLRDLAVPEGVVRAGPPGAGHFVKLIHNAIEFGMLQALGEGLDLLVRSDYALDLPALFHNWNHGSVIRGWLVQLMEQGLRKHNLNDLSSRVEDTREVKWAVEYALEKEAWVPVIALSELALYRYQLKIGKQVIHLQPIDLGQDDFLEPSDCRHGRKPLGGHLPLQVVAPEHVPHLVDEASPGLAGLLAERS